MTENKVIPLINELIASSYPADGRMEQIKNSILSCEPFMDTVYIRSMINDIYRNAFSLEVKYFYG